MVRFLGAVDLWTLCGGKEAAVHIESRKTANIKVSLEFKSSGMQEMYLSALETDFKVPINSWMGTEKFPNFWEAITSLDTKLLSILDMDRARRVLEAAGSLPSPDRFNLTNL